MSRILGRSYDVYLASKELREARIKKYKDDYTRTTWESVISSPEKYKIYLPQSALEFLDSKPIKIRRDPFFFFLEMQIPDTDNQDRYIMFPSFIAVENFKTEYAYYIGMLLSYYHTDNEEDLYTFPKEYSDLLPMLMVYLHLKANGKEKEFVKKYLSILSNYVGTYITDYEAYDSFEEFYSGAVITEMTEKRYEDLNETRQENEEKMVSAVGETIIQLSALDGALQIIDRCKTKEDFKQMIEKLFINEPRDRSSILRSEGIESFGYKRLRKEIEASKKQLQNTTI